MSDDGERLQGHLRTELIPWDDSDFVKEYERAHEQVVREGLLINGPRAAARLEALMRAAGYPRVSVKVDRTTDDALRHAARWTVRRDGAPAIWRK
jgi:predicted ribonuclease toxin of YeeF-YezG toxin-antitoxin module